MSTSTLVTFIIYFILLLGIGFYFYRKSVSIEDYLLGGRRMGAWVTALSAQASDMSGWLLMALPGAIYAYGMGKVWIAIGLFAGTVLNWKLVSGRLRVYTQKTDTITLPCFFEQRFGDPTGLLRVVSAIIILLFFTIYASAHLQATGYLLESTFGIQYGTAVIVGGSIIIAYTFLGGFLAVCWTDLFQGSLMVLALIVVPSVAYLKVGGAETIRQAMKLKEISTSLLPAKGTAGLLAIVSMMAWGLGYFGQPHILTRFMSVKSVRKLPQSMTIAIIWVFLSLTGAVIIGFVGIGMFENLDIDQHEHQKVFIYMIGKVMHPWLAGIMLAAILSAIMSTIDSQLLVSSSALTEDFYQKAIKKNATEKEIILVGRICVIIISVIALILALRPSDTILRIVAYSWGGFRLAIGFSRDGHWNGRVNCMEADRFWRRIYV
ncbi:MAG: sodium/proline symporter PutP [Planctomycetota bacterium]|jgi:sodium/proline symporter